MTEIKEKPDSNAHRRKWQEAALIVPVLGLCLLIPPFISIFSIKISFFGVPLIVLYIFLVWITLILTTRFLSIKLMQNDPGQENEPDADGNGNGNGNGDNL